MALGRPEDFFQELMLRISNSEDRLIPEKDITKFNRDLLIAKEKDNMYYYITTDAGTSESKTADFSVIEVWGVDHKGVKHLVDWWLGKVVLSVFIDELFKMVTKWKQNLQGVGIEVNGQQYGTISILEKE